MSFISEDSSISRDTGRISTPILEHTRPPQDEEPVRKGRSLMYYCKHCIAWSAQNTTNLRQHLQAKHGITVTSQSRRIDTSSNTTLQSLYEKAMVVNQTSELDAQILKRALSKEIITQAIVSLIVAENLSFRIVESPYFHTLCKALNPAASNEVISSHSTIKEHIRKSWLFHKDIVRKKLQSSRSVIHLSIDVWTSPNQKLFLAVCAHFVDLESETLQKALIGLPFISSHHATTQYKALFYVLQDYDILSKIGTIISDNAPTNDKLCKILEATLSEKAIPWSSSDNRIRCNGHIINLTVQAFLFQDTNQDEDQLKDAQIALNLNPLIKLHNIISHIRGSPGRINQFIQLAGRMIPLDNSTRWNSWYLMIQTALEKESAIDSYIKSWYEPLQKDYLSPDDWEYLRLISAFLHPFYRATKATEGDQATIDRVLFTMDILIQHFKKSLATYKSNPFLLHQIDKSWAVFDKYYLKTDESPFYAAAVIFHPSRRTLYLKHNWDKKWIRPAINSVKKLWEEHKDQTANSSPTMPSMQIDDNLDEFDILAQNLDILPIQQTKDDFEEYISEAAIPIQTSALSWWLNAQQQQRWPRLSQLAINVLSIPAMSAEPERVFSGARRTISWERMQLSEDTIEFLECLKHWMRSGLVNIELGEMEVDHSGD